MKKFVITHLTILLSSLLLAQEIEPDLKLTAEESDGITKLKAVNLTYGFIDLYVKREGSEEVEDSTIIAPLDTVFFKELGEGNRDTLVADFNSEYNIGYFLGGDPLKLTPDEGYLYSLPYAIDKKYPISQAANGKFSHSGPISKYAIDFQLEIGEAVHASREGRVIKVVQNFKEAGGRELLWKANRIVILHSDGTTASYVHLDYEAALVKEGDFVKRGQHIGYSGNTGFSRGPHLHFVVRKEKDISIPVYFEGYEGVVLKRRRKYRRRL